MGEGGWGGGGGGKGISKLTIVFFFFFFFFLSIEILGICVDEPSVELIVVFCFFFVLFFLLFSFNSSISAVHQFNAIKEKTELLLETF